jgi:hypothetical protein
MTTMRFTLLALALLTSAAPVSANPGDGGEPGDHRGAMAERVREMRAERQEQREERREEAREAPPEARSAAMEDVQASARRMERMERRERVERASEPEPVLGETDRREALGRTLPVERAERAERMDERWHERERGSAESAAGAGDSVANWRWRERNAERAERGARDRGERIVDAPASPVGATPPRGDLRNAAVAQHWREDWRRDRRYDWRSHRRQNRSLFRVGIYIDPFGWNYRRFNIGWNLYPSYYSSRYWLNDPWNYRLPRVPYGFRWVRYHGDALLVDLRRGRVVDVLYDVFW